MRLRAGEEERFRILDSGRRFAIYLTNVLMAEALPRCGVSGSDAGGSSGAEIPLRPGRYSDVHDLAIITVTMESRWMRSLLPTVFDHVGEISVDVVVVDNDSKDGTAELVANQFPEARTLWSANHGFGYANNRGLMTCNARYVLFLNPDTEIIDGTFADLVRLMDERPNVGLVGCRQIIAEDGSLCPTGRYFPERAPSAWRCRDRRAACRGVRVGSVSVSSTCAGYDARVRLRLDDGLVYARASRGARKCRLV